MTIASGSVARILLVLHSAIHSRHHIKTGSRRFGQQQSILCGASAHVMRGVRLMSEEKGKRWDAENAEALMAIEALHQSKQWHAYWANAAEDHHLTVLGKIVGPR